MDNIADPLPRDRTDTSFDWEDALEKVGYANYDLRDATIKKMFASTTCSDLVKLSWVVEHIDEASALQWGEAFLTEEIIMHSLNDAGRKDWRYPEALARSSHLSIPLAHKFLSAEWMDNDSRGDFLALVPDAVITPETIRLIKFFGEGDLLALPEDAEVFTKIAAERIRRIFPEYAELPDQWTVDLFSGQ